MDEDDDGHGHGHDGGGDGHGHGGGSDEDDDGHGHGDGGDDGHGHGHDGGDDGHGHGGVSSQKPPAKRKSLKPFHQQKTFKKKPSTMHKKLSLFLVQEVGKQKSHLGKSQRDKSHQGQSSGREHT